MSAISSHTKGAEQAVGFSLEADKCPICLDEYTEKDLNDPEKVVELFCNHYFHLSCINRWTLSTVKDPHCPTCKRKFTHIAPPPVQINEDVPFAAFENKEILSSLLKHRQKKSAHDKGALLALNEVEDMQEILIEIKEQLTQEPVLEEASKEMFIYRAGWLVVARKDIVLKCKQAIMREIECILRIGEVRTDLRAPVSPPLKTTAEEAERWRDVPFQDWPEQMRTGPNNRRANPKEGQTQEYGVVVKGEEGPMRVSARHIQRCLRRPKVSEKGATKGLKEVQIENFVMGPPVLLRYMGVVKTLLPFPAELEAILNSPCFFYPGKQLKETHLVWMCPEIIKIAGKLIRVSLENAETIMHGLKWRVNVLFPRSMPQEQRQYIESATILKARWIAITKGPIPYSQCRSYKEQKELIHEMGKGLYKCPSALDILLSTYLDFQKTGKLFGEKWDASVTSRVESHSICEERLSADSPQDVISGCVMANLDPLQGDLLLQANFRPELWPHGCVGMAAVRKFPEETS